MQTDVPANELLADDYSTSRVPLSARTPMLNVLWVQLGIVTAMSEFVVASTLGYGMTFWEALIATVLGTAVLIALTVLIGIAGAREGLPSGMLARWSGFGRYGSCLISLVVVFGCTAWFGIQNSICAEAIQRGMHGRVSLTVASVFTGLALTLIATLGFHWVAKTAAAVVPMFLVLITYGTFRVLSTSPLKGMFSAPAPGPRIPIFTGASMVIGGLIIGAIVAPDFTRFCRKGIDVFWAITIALLIGEIGLGSAGVLLAHAAHTRDIVGIIFGVAGWLGVAVVVLATVKLNDLNLYSASLHLANIIQVVTGRKPNRAILSIVLGIAGILFSIAGILDRVGGLLLVLGISVPPIGGILVVDYFILGRGKELLAPSRETLSLPATAEAANPVALIAWAVGAVGGYYIPAGMGSLNAVLLGGLVYYIIMKLVPAPIRKPETIPVA
jgi:cytosine permease